MAVRQYPPCFMRPLASRPTTFTALSLTHRSSNRSESSESAAPVISTELLEMISSDEDGSPPRGYIKTDCMSSFLVGLDSIVFGNAKRTEKPIRPEELTSPQAGIIQSDCFASCSLTRMGAPPGSTVRAKGR